MPNLIEFERNGLQLQLFAERAVFWPDQSMLLIADTHFGKEATFRHHGIPVPVGSTDGTLHTISSLLEFTAADHLVILGDMFHARSSLSKEVTGSLDAFFLEHSGLSTTLVRGNHDAHLGQLPPSWSIEIVEQNHRIDRLALAHHPNANLAGAELLLCGHLHPAIRVGGSLGKLPCFHLREGVMVLPAIGQFTGTHLIKLRRADQAWAVTGDEIIAMAASPIPLHE